MPFIRKYPFTISLGLDDAAAIMKFLKVHHTVLADARVAHTAYKVVSCPTSIVIDKYGVIRFIQVTGENIGERLAPSIRAIL